MKDFSRPRQNGVNAITINEGDTLLEAALTDGNCYIMMAVKSGRAIRFIEEKVRPTGRGAIGVTGIEVDDLTDEVVGMACVNKDDKTKTILVVSEKGIGKRTNLDYFNEETKEWEEIVSPVNSLLHTSGLKNFADTEFITSSQVNLGILTAKDSTITLINDNINESRVDIINNFDLVIDVDILQSN